jgi:hypothetical protein
MPEGKSNDCKLFEMKDFDYFKRQFLLTVHDNLDLPWDKRKILNYYLYYHPDLEFEFVTYKKIELYLLGFILDYANPSYSNKQILDLLSHSYDFDHFIEQICKYSGHYVIVYKSDEKFIILNDACAQHEIYYDTLFSSFGTQPKLISKVIPLLPHSSAEAAEFYSSSMFLSKKLFVGETTHMENIKHLNPNHYIDIGLKLIIRFFPKEHIKPISIDKAATKACEMLKGFIKAASLRNKLYMGVTGGYDSRVLFLASLDVECEYYVTKLGNMDDEHYDIVIPQKLTKIHNKEFKIITESIDQDIKGLLDISIDFPREVYKPVEEFINHVLINGNLSEIARNYYGYYKKIRPKELAILYGYGGNKFVYKEFEKWLQKSARVFSEKGYNVLDMFYWEEKMGKWAAKAKTEMSAIGTLVYSPFCSHELLTTLLSTPRKFRDENSNKLYDRIINIYSPKAINIPTNPSQKKSILLLLKKLKLLNFIQSIRLKLKLIKTL